MKTGSPIVIKRYANRKLYDTRLSRYVTLDELGQRVRNGEMITVTDKNSQRDLTALTLIRMLFESEKKSDRPLSVETLHKIIVSGKTLTHFIENLMGVRPTPQEGVEPILEEGAPTAPMSVSEKSLAEVDSLITNPPAANELTIEKPIDELIH